MRTASIASKDRIHECVMHDPVKHRCRSVALIGYEPQQASETPSSRNSPVPDRHGYMRLKLSFSGKKASLVRDAQLSRQKVEIVAFRTGFFVAVGAELDVLGSDPTSHAHQQSVGSQH